MPAIEQSPNQNTKRNNSIKGLHLSYTRNQTRKEKLKKHPWIIYTQNNTGEKKKQKFVYYETAIARRKSRSMFFVCRVPSLVLERQLIQAVSAERNYTAKHIN